MIEHSLGDIHRRLTALEQNSVAADGAISAMSRRLAEISKLIAESDKYRVNRGLMVKPGDRREGTVEILQQQIDMLFEAFAPTQEGANASPSLLDQPDLPLTTGLAKAEAQPQEGTDYFVTVALPATMGIGEYLDKCKEHYYSARGPGTLSAVMKKDCWRSAKEMQGLFDQWMVFTGTLASANGKTLNTQMLSYLRETVVGMVDVMNQAVDEVSKPA